MSDLTTTAPAEIDAQLAELYHAEFALEAKVRAALDAIHRGLGERVTVTGRGASRREEWPTSDADAIAAMAAKGDELIGMMRTASSILDRHEQAAAALAENRAAQSPLHAEYNRRGGWTRFFSVTGGHIHREQNCPTLHRGKQRTQLGWLIEMSGTDEKKAIADLAAGAHILCSVCIPGAPVVSAPAQLPLTPAEKAANRAAAERKARIEDDKLIADTDGEPLVVDGGTLRTVRAAEIKAVDSLWWAASARRDGERNADLAARYEGQARKIAAALAHKRGTTEADELAALVVKAIKKVRRDLGAEAADAAAAAWATQAEAAAAGEQLPDVADMRAELARGGVAYPMTDTEVAEAYRAIVQGVPAEAPLTEQPQPQHAGRDEQAEALGATEDEQLADAADYAAATEAPAPGRATIQQGDGPALPGQIFHADTATVGVTIQQTVDAADYQAALAEAGDAATVLALRQSLAAIGQVTRELTNDQVAELGRRIASARPVHAGVPLDPFLAARLAAAETGTAARTCCTADSTDADCEQVHPGFTSPTAAYAALAAELEVEAGDPDGYLAAHLAALDDAAAAVRDSGATWATWDAHGRPAAAMLFGASGTIDHAAGLPATFDLDDLGRVVARSVSGRYVTTTVPTAEWLLFVPPAGDDAACRFCGCTENAACPGGCAWASDGQLHRAGLEPMDGDVCTACLTAGLPAGAEPVTDRPLPGSWFGWVNGRRACTFLSRAAGDQAIARRDVDAISPAEHYGRSRQQAHLERDQDDDYNVGDEERDCVRVTTRVDEAGQRWQWCATHRTDEPIGPDDDDAALDDAAEFDAGVASVLALAAAAPPAVTVTVTDPAGLFELIKEYGVERASAVVGAELSGPEMHDAYQARADAVLARIAEALGVPAEPAVVPAPRVGGGPQDAPPAV